MSSRVKTTSGAQQSSDGTSDEGARSATGPLAGETPAARSGFSFGGPARESPAASRGGRSLSLRGFAVGKDGTPLYYRVTGNPDGGGLPVALCDGIGCDGYVWKYLRPELGRDRLVVHFHYRGHGRTPLPRDPDRIAIGDLSDDLGAVLDAASANVRGHVGGADDRFRRVWLAGHSMGVQVCLETWRRHRERVAGLALLCGAYGTPLRTFKNSRALEEMLPLARLVVHAVPAAARALFRAIMPTQLSYRVATLFEINGDLVRPDDFFPYLEHMAKVDPRLFVDMLAAAGRHTAREILARIDVPTLVVAGDRDGFTPLTLSEEMHRLIPGCEMHVVRPGSHTAPIEKPEEVTGAVADFVRSH